MTGKWQAEGRQNPSSLQNLAVDQNIHFSLLRCNIMAAVLMESRWVQCIIRFVFLKGEILRSCD